MFAVLEKEEKQHYLFCHVCGELLPGIKTCRVCNSELSGSKKEVSTSGEEENSRDQGKA